MEKLRRAFLKNHWEWDENPLLDKNITVKTKLTAYNFGMWLYNYNDLVLVERNNPVLMRCRGLVIDDDSNILNYPFNRFFNYWEKERQEIDWDSASVQEKVDGSLINVFWNGNNWEITTRGSFYPNENADVDFARLFKNMFNSFYLLSKGICYMFELVTKQNRIVTWYDEECVYLIGARDLFSFKEYSQQSLDNMATFLECKRPKRYNAIDVGDCLLLFDKFKPDDEGLVIVDNEFNRLKIKQERGV